MVSLKLYRFFLFSFFIVYFAIALQGCQKDTTPTEGTTSKDNLSEITGYPIVGTNQTTFYIPGLRVIINITFCNIWI